ncbi:MAG: cell division protein FtsA [Deferribacterales bacterium]|jgi:cell division protein FtsA
MATDNIFVGLDFGTTKICAVVASKNEDGSLDIIGLGKAPSEGIRRGVVVNIDSTVNSIREAVAEAERMSGVQIKRATAGIAGGHIKSFNQRGTIAVKGGREITQKDVERVIETAAATNITVGNEILAILPQQFILDGQSEIKDPVGMTGVRLEADVHIITGAVSSAQNIVKSCEKAGIIVDDIVLEQLASSESVLSDDEKEIGVCIIDGGGGTSDMAVYKQGAVFHTAALLIGGRNFTKDLAIGLNTPESEAEKLKIKHGCVWMPLVEEDDVIEVPTVGGRPPREVGKPVVTQILQARAEEVFQIFKGELQYKGLMDHLGAGVVITGGFANHEGIEHLAAEILGVPVRLGKPSRVGGLSDHVTDPKYATAVGLAMVASRKGHQPGNKLSGNDEKAFTNVLGRMKSWFGEFF